MTMAQLMATALRKGEDPTEAIAQIREVRKEFLDERRLPASTMVGVAALAKDDLLLEVEAYAVRRGADA